MRSFSILLFDGFSNLCLANAVEPLRAANRLSSSALYDWHFIGMSASTVTSSSGLPVRLERTLSESSGDYLYVMPSYDYKDLVTPGNLRQFRAAKDRFRLIAGLDTGSWLLASAGLLDGYRATSHWDILSSLSEKFPDVDVTEDRFVIDRDRASCGGATTTLELMLELIEQHHGSALALEVAALFMFGERDPDLDPMRHIPANRTVRAAAAIMRRNIETPLSIEEVAKQAGTDQRRLEQMFRKSDEQSPVQIYRRIRLAEARRRIEQTTESVAEIASRCGYKDSSAMTRAFKAEFGSPPSAWRRH